VQQAYVYPALGGPSTNGVTLLKRYDRDLGDYSRALTNAALNLVRSRILAELPDEVEKIITTVTDVETDVAIQVTIPDSPLAGGNGRGWLDASPWPPLSGSDTRVSVSAVSSSSSFTVNASTSTSPVAGQTRVCWWNPRDKRFEQRTVISVGGTAGAWVLGTDRPFVDSDGTPIAVGDYVSPAAQNMTEYGKTWVDVLDLLGPGERTADANRLPRAKRQPFIDDETPEDIGAVQLLELKRKYPEIVDIQYSYRENTSPSVPASVDDPANVLSVGALGVYPI
jgi:hypothetical protein